MKLIITMAGLGTRFKKIGISKPKYKIIAQNKTLFEWAMLSLQDFFDEKFIFITRKEIFDEVFIKEKCLTIGIKDYECITLDETTDGQATTAYFADKCVCDSESCIIYNIDTYVKPRRVLKKHIKGNYDGFIPVIRASGNRWSFVKVDSKNRVTDVAEKKSISNLATIGFYYFKYWKVYKEIYLKEHEKIYKANKEVYIAPMYKTMIQQKGNIGILLLEHNDVYILGTPEEINNFDPNYLSINS